MKDLTITFNDDEIQLLNILLGKAKHSKTLEELIQKLTILQAKTFLQQLENEDKKAIILNHYLKEELKFPYYIAKTGEIGCDQFGKLKQIKYSLYNDRIFIYLLKKGCPNKATPKQLQEYSVRLDLEEFYLKLWDKESWDRIALPNIVKIIDKSQREWKKNKYKK